MPTEENKAIVRREVEELYNPDGDLDAVEEIFAPDYVLHDPSLPEEGRGPEAARQLATAFRERSGTELPARRSTSVQRSSERCGRISRR